VRRAIEHPEFAAGSSTDARWRRCNPWVRAQRAGRHGRARKTPHQSRRSRTPNSAYQHRRTVRSSSVRRHGAPSTLFLAGSDSALAGCGTPEEPRNLRNPEELGRLRFVCFRRAGLSGAFLFPGKRLRSNAVAFGIAPGRAVQNAKPPATTTARLIVIAKRGTFTDERSLETAILFVASPAGARCSLPIPRRAWRREWRSTRNRGRHHVRRPRPHRPATGLEHGTDEIWMWVRISGCVQCSPPIARALRAHDGVRLGERADRRVRGAKRRRSRGRSSGLHGDTWAWKDGNWIDLAPAAREALLHRNGV
jgi:hypothetical protein